MGCVERAGPIAYSGDLVAETLSDKVWEVAAEISNHIQQSGNNSGSLVGAA